MMRIVISHHRHHYYCHRFMCRKGKVSKAVTQAQVINPNHSLLSCPMLKKKKISYTGKQFVPSLILLIHKK